MTKDEEKEVNPRHFYVNGVCIVHNIGGFSPENVRVCTQNNEPQLLMVSEDFISAARGLFEMSKIAAPNVCGGSGVFHKKFEMAITRMEQALAGTERKEV